MRLVAQLVVDVDDNADQDLVRATIETAAGEHVRVVSASIGSQDTAYRVVGTIRGKPDETFETVVYAQSEEAAKQAAFEEDTTRAVADAQDAGLPTGTEQFPLPVNPDDAPPPEPAPVDGAAASP